MAKRRSGAKQGSTEKDFLHKCEVFFVQDPGAALERALVWAFLPVTGVSARKRNMRAAARQFLSGLDESHANEHGFTFCPFASCGLPVLDTPRTATLHDSCKEGMIRTCNRGDHFYCADYRHWRDQAYGPRLLMARSIEVARGERISARR